MLAIERRNKILEKLEAERKVVVGELSGLYGVSEETIRRDLEKLEAEGYVIKSYGGAVLNENANIDMPFKVRKNKNVIGKQKIAALLRGIIRDGESIFLDASSTAAAVAKAIGSKNGITVITNSMEIALESLGNPGLKVISTGGIVTEKSLALVGQVTDRMICSYYADKAIISCKGFDLKTGFTDSDERHANNKRSMLDSAREKILAADHSKFGNISFARIGDLNDIGTVVTDRRPDDEWMREFALHDVRCIYPEQTGESEGAL